MAIAKLTVDLVAQLAGFERDLQRAAVAAEKSASQMESAFSLAKAGLAGLAQGIAGGLSAAAITTYFKSIVDGLDKLNDVADVTGASIENISALEDVAARTGTSFDSMSSALVKFNKILGDAKEGSAVANNLKAIGLSATELKRADPAEALRQTAVALSNFADDGNKARIVQELFGKSVSEVGPFLKDLAEQTQLVGKVTKEEAKSAEDFNKQLFQMGKNATDAGRAIAGPFLSAFNELESRLKKSDGFLEKYKELFTLRPFGKDLFGGDNVAEEAKKLEVQLTAVGKVLEKEGLSEERRNRLLAQQVQLRERLADLRAKGSDGSFDAAEGRRLTSKPTVGAIQEADSKGLSELEKYTQQLEAATLASLELSKEDEARIKIASGELGQLTKAQEEYLITLAKGIDLAKEKPKNFVDTSALEAEIALQREMNSLLQTIPTAKLEKQKKLQDALKFAFEQGTISVQQYHEALGELIPITEKLADETNSFAKEAAANIQDELGNTLEDVLSGSFDNIGKNWERLLVRMAAQAAAAKLNQQLFGSDYGKTGQIGGLIGSLIGGGGGGGSGYPTIGSGAGDSSGYITPSAGPQSASGGRLSMGNTYNIQVGSDVSRGEVYDAVTKAVAASEGRQMQRLRAAGVV